MYNDLPRLTRREWLKLSAAGVLGASASGWLENLATAAAAHPARKRACILLWMNGGPPQTDTFDMKPGHKNGGPYKEIETSAAGRMQTREMNQHWSMNSRVWNGRWKIPTATSRPSAKSFPVAVSAPAPGKFPAARRLLTRHSDGTCA